MSESESNVEEKVSVSNEGTSDPNPDATTESVTATFIPTEGQKDLSNSKKEEDDEVMKEETENDEEESSSRKLESIEALTEAHSSLKLNLEHANAKLSEKTWHVKELEEDVSRQTEKNWLMEEKIRSLTERECILTRIVEEKEKRLENVQAELSDANWKLQEAEQFLQKLEADQAELKTRQDLYQPKILELEVETNEDGSNEEKLTVKQLYEDVQRLQSFKNRLNEGDPELTAIQSGAKMLEIEEGKRGLEEAHNETALRIDAMYLEVDELSERIDEKTKSIENAKKEHESNIWQLKNQLQCLQDTERRLQRSVEYINSKIDYGMDVPAPTPTPGPEQESDNS